MLGDTSIWVAALLMRFPCRVPASRGEDWGGRPLVVLKGYQKVMLVGEET